MKHCECTQYTDDTQIYLHAYPNDVDEDITLIEKDAQAVASTEGPGTKCEKDESNDFRPHAIHCLH